MSDNLPNDSLMRAAISRRDALRGVAVLGGGVALLPVLSQRAEAQSAMDTGLAPLAPAPDGVRRYDLEIAETDLRLDGRRARAVTINGTVPGPVLRFREGETAEIHVRNRLDEDTSVHWHGILLPPEMDGVPGLSFDGIRPGETFVYRFPLKQSGTYWYHSHSGLQEQLGHYGSLVVEPAAPPAQTVDREFVIVLSDWTFENPERVLSRLKKQPDAYNYQRRTLGTFFRDVARDGFSTTVQERLMWAGMRMNPTDIADVTGVTYSFLLNGATAEAPWQGQFRPGERVKLRFINAAAGSMFDVRIPGLPMTVVQVSGQPVEPVETDEFRIANAETYDVIVRLDGDRAYTIFAEAMDRSGFTAGVLAPREGLRAEVPPRRRRAVLGMADMGMDHGATDHAAMGHGAPTPAVDHAAMGHAMPAAAAAVGAVSPDTPHSGASHGVQNAMVPAIVKSRLHEPGLGLGADGRRVLTYADLRAPYAWPDTRPPSREIELHITGNMERYTWGFDGVPYHEAKPIELTLGERIRLVLVNDTMMHHPIHLHGLWMELENGQGERMPRIHTINVKPAERVTLLVSADAAGRWAFHCHILFHMEVGMFREFRVVAGADPHAHHHGASDAN